MTGTYAPDVTSNTPRPDLQPDPDWPARWHRRLKTRPGGGEPRALVEVEKA